MRLERVAGNDSKTAGNQIQFCFPEISVGVAKLTQHKSTLTLDLALTGPLGPGNGKGRKTLGVLPPSLGSHGLKPNFMCLP